MLKRYKVNDAWFWYEEGEQPDGAIEEKAAKAREEIKDRIHGV